MRISEIVNDDDLFDSRELVEALGPLVEEDEEDAELIAAIAALFEEVSGYAGDTPEDGITFIRDSYFETYAETLADDLGMTLETPSWPL